ncbi:hypothetical protein SPD48_09435 [Pseudogracilibacillus sp. SE30717A]|uniref:hypothetical protein n=1 Tax=Pseudogracilibacillus sp. SE30717A TaxID=3098293 RepID=UPI00300DDAD8
MEYTDVLLIAVIVGLVELLKKLNLPHKLLPVASLIFGLIGGVFYLFPNDLKAGILTGIIIGLSASGLYSGVKNTVEDNE